MSNIEVINRIAEDKKKAEYIAYRVQMKRDEGDDRPFGDILQEEIDKLKAIENTGK